MRRALVFVLSTLVMLSTAGCGFKLRGLTELPPAMDRVELLGAETFSDIGLMLRQLLKVNGATLVGESDNPTIRLLIQDTSRRREVVALGSTGKAVEFQLIYEVAFSAQTGAGEPLFDRRTVSMRRDYAYSETEIVSRTAAEEQIYVELVQEAAWQIIEQLSAAAG